MSGLALSADELIAWNDKTAQDWRALGNRQPEILALPCDIYTATTVGELLQHVVAVELRYAERLSAAATVTDYKALPYWSAEEIFSVHDRALGMLRLLLADPAYDWALAIEFQTLTQGPLRAPRQAVLFHLLLHGVRHYAQLATLVRSAGYPAGFAMDYLLMAAERI